MKITGRTYTIQLTEEEADIINRALIAVKGNTIGMLKRGEISVEEYERIRELSRMFTLIR